MEKSAEQLTLAPTTLVIFGITGDLSRRYILPALADLHKNGQLPADFKLVGISRREINVSEVLTAATKVLKPYLDMVQMDVAEIADYQKIKHKLTNSRQTIFYFAVPPAALPPILDLLAEAGLNKGNTKLLLEKPFGRDLKSAEELVAHTKKCFSEDQIYRIDHYMAKEMSQNIAVFLGSNALFRSVWSNQAIDSIDVMAIEKIGIEGRVDFYEPVGALRDLIQGHLMNLAALTLMRPCSSLFEFEELPQRRLEALRALETADPKLSVRGQYAGYLKEVNNPASQTETFACVELKSTDPRWHGVPIRLTTGKNLKSKFTEIRVRFKKADESQANLLVLRIQPEEGVEIDLWAKNPGFDSELRRLPLKFNYAEGVGRLPNAYEQVLVDAMRSRSSLFTSSAEVLESWRILQPVLESWQAGKVGLKTYEPGSAVEEVLPRNV